MNAKNLSQNEMWIGDSDWETTDGDPEAYAGGSKEAYINADLLFPEAEFQPDFKSRYKFLLISTVLACLVVGWILSRLDFFFTPVNAKSIAGPDAAQKGTALSDNQTLDSSITDYADIPGPEETTSECLVSDHFPAKILRWCGLISQNATRRGLPPDLVAAVILQESGGNPNAYSQSGAVGLMQVMPKDGIAASFQCAGGPCFANRPSASELKDPEFNILYGTKMLAGLVGKSGDLREGLRSYGPMDVGYSYADRVIGLYQRYGQ
jgi:hypothetical protein